MICMCVIVVHLVIVSEQLVMHQAGHMLANLSFKWYVVQWSLH